MGGWNTGIFTKTYSWVQDAANGIKIRADRHDVNDTDFVNGINNCITKDGQNTATGNLPMGGFRHTGVSDAAARNQYLTLGQYQDQDSVYVTTGGSADTYTITSSPSIGSYVEGQKLSVKIHATNTASSTVNINGIGAQPIYKGVSTELDAGDLLQDRIYDFVYDGTAFQITPTLGTMATQNANAVAITGGDISGVDFNFSNASSATSVLADELLFIDVGDSNATKKQTIEGVLQNQMALGYISGLVPSNDAGDTSHDILISEGQCRDALDTQNIRMTNNIIKQIDANWAAGDGAGGFPSGLTIANDTWYHVFVIATPSGTVDAGFDTSLTATNLLTDATGYTKYRRVGSFRTDGSANIRPLVYTEVMGGGVRSTWTTVPLDVDVVNLSTTAVSYTISTPTGVQCLAQGTAITTTPNGAQVYLSDLNMSDQAPSLTASPGITAIENDEGSTHFWQIQTNTSSQIRARALAASTNLRLATHGFIDYRR